MWHENTIYWCPNTLLCVTEYPPLIVSPRRMRCVPDHVFLVSWQKLFLSQHKYFYAVAIQFTNVNWDVSRKTEKMESFYLFIFAKWFCIFANGYQLFRLEERNTSTAHRCIAIIQYYQGKIFNLFATLLTWWPAESRCYSGDRSEWSHSWGTVEMNNNAWILIKLVTKPVKKSKKISKFSFSTLSKRKTVISCV